MLFGYARVSTKDQDTAAQIAALKNSGCELIFQEKASGGRWDRPELHRLLGQLRNGDVLVVWKLDRLSRSLKDLLTLMDKIDRAGAGFRSLTEVIDTTSPGGRMMMQIVGTFAEFERSMLRERTQRGLDAAPSKAVSVVADQNSRRTNSRKSCIWLILGRRSQRMPPDCSTSIRLPYPVY